MASNHSQVERAPGAVGRLRLLLEERQVRFSTPSLDDAQSHLQAQHESIALKVRDPSSFREYRELHLPPLHSVGLTLGCIDAAVGYELSFRSGDEMLVNIPLRGHGWVDGGSQTFEMVAGQILLVGPSCQVTKHWQGPGQVLGLHIPLDTLTEAMNVSCARSMPLYLPPITLIDHGRLHTLLAFIELLVHDSHAGIGPLGDKAVATHAERLLLALLIDGLKLTSNDSAKQCPDLTAQPYYVRRADAYMRAHANAELNIEELASEVGVSVRALQYGFRKSLATSPMQHFKRVRLELAREALRAAGTQHCKVSTVAMASGFMNVSQFSRDYRAMFGETPSETVAAPRRLCVSAE